MSAHCGGASLSSTAKGGGKSQKRPIAIATTLFNLLFIAFSAGIKVVAAAVAVNWGVDRSRKRYMIVGGGAAKR